MRVKDYAKEVSAIAGISIKEAEQVVWGIFRTIAKALQNKESVQIRGFGSFKVTHSPSRLITPHTKQFANWGTIKTTPRNRVRFKPAAGLIALLFYDYKGTHDSSPPRSPRKNNPRV